jgi:hypothetical protein
MVVYATLGMALGVNCGAECCVAAESTLCIAEAWLNAFETLLRWQKPSALVLGNNTDCSRTEPSKIAGCGALNATS